MMIFVLGTATSGRLKSKFPKRHLYTDKFGWRLDERK